MAYRRTQMQGVAELKAALNGLGVEVATKTGVAANRRAALVARDALVEAAPYADEQSPSSKAYGHLKTNIRVRKVPANRATRIRHIIDTGAAFWGRFVELGTALMSAHPWWRPTIDRVEGAMFTAQIDELQKGIDRAARRLARNKAKGG